MVWGSKAITGALAQMDWKECGDRGREAFMRIYKENLNLRISWESERVLHGIAVRLPARTHGISRPLGAFLAEPLLLESAERM